MFAARATINPGSISFYSDTTAPQETSFFGCEGNINGAFNYRQATGGSGNYIYIWQYRVDDYAPWITKKTTTNPFDFIIVTVQNYKDDPTYVRRIAKDISFPQDSAITTPIIVYCEFLDPGTISFTLGHLYAYVPIGFTPVPSIVTDQFHPNTSIPPLNIEFGRTEQGSSDTNYIYNGSSSSYNPPKSDTSVTFNFWRCVIDGCGYHRNDKSYHVVLQYYTTPDYDPGSIRTDTNNVAPGTIARIIASPTTVPNQLRTYQWQSSADSATWTDVPSSNFDTLTVIVQQSLFYRRVIYSEFNKKGIYVSNKAKLNNNLGPCVVPSNNAQSGIKVWNVFTYNGQNLDLTGGTTFKGYYVDSASNMNTSNRWNISKSPSFANNYLGCEVDTSNFTIDAKKQGFTYSEYQFRTKSYNNWLRMKLIDYTLGVQPIIYNSPTCCNAKIPTIPLGILSPDVELEIIQTVGSTNTHLEFLVLNVDTNIVASFNDTICKSYDLRSKATNNFNNIVDDSGSMVAAINPKYQNLGVITVNVKQALPGVSNIPVGFGNAFVMPRLFKLESSTYGINLFPSPVTTRLYFLNSELDNYKIATNQPGLSIAGLRVIQYNGPNADCSPFNNNGTYNTIPITGFGYVGTNAFYIDVSLNKFSELNVVGTYLVFPIKWLSVNASVKSKNAIIDWRVANAVNTYSYEVYRSKEGRKFSKVGIVKSNTSQSKYSFNDNIEGISENALYYKIREVCNDGKYSYSNIVKADLQQSAHINLAPNPAKNIFQISAMTPIAQITISDLAGRIIMTTKEQNKVVHQNIALLNRGVYIIKVELTNGTKQQLKLVKE